MKPLFINVYERDGETIATDPWNTREEARKAGPHGLPGHRWVLMAKTKSGPAGGLRKPKWEEMGEGRA